MPGFGDIVQKAFYLGVGLASYASEKAGGTLQELRVQAQKLADELVARGEMTAEEARKLVDDLVQQAQSESVDSSKEEQPSQPRRIEIVSDEEKPAGETSESVDSLRKQLETLKDELNRLKRD